MCRVACSGKVQQRSSDLHQSRRQKTLLLGETVGVSAGASSSLFSLARSSFCHPPPPRTFSRIRAANSFPLKTFFSVTLLATAGVQPPLTVDADAFSVNGSEAC